MGVGKVPSIITKESQTSLGLSGTNKGGTAEGKTEGGGGSDSIRQV